MENKYLTSKNLIELAHSFYGNIPGNFAFAAISNKENEIIITMHKGKNEYKLLITDYEVIINDKQFKQYKSLIQGLLYKTMYSVYGEDYQHDFYNYWCNKIEQNIESRKNEPKVAMFADYLLADCKTTLRKSIERLNAELTEENKNENEN